MKRNLNSRWSIMKLNYVNASRLITSYISTYSSSLQQCDTHKRRLLRRHAYLVLGLYCLRWPRWVGRFAGEVLAAVAAPCMVTYSVSRPLTSIHKLSYAHRDYGVVLRTTQCWPSVCDPVTLLSVQERQWHRASAGWSEQNRRVSQSEADVAFVRVFYHNLQTSNSVVENMLRITMKNSKSYSTTDVSDVL